MQYFIGLVIVLLFLALSGCQHKKDSSEMSLNQDSIPFSSGYSDVNGLHMYYEIYGEGKPLVLLHGGGSTIHTSFGRIIPLLAKHRQVIGVELQAHGRTNDRNAELSFEQDADDVAALLKNLKIEKADFFGFSNGGSTALQLALRHPQLVNKLIIASTFFKRSGAPEQFWEFMKNAKLENMPEAYRKAYREVALHPEELQIMHDKCARRMVNFQDVPDEQIRSVQVPVLLVAGDADVVRVEHAVEMSRLIPDCRLAIFPGGHGKYMGEITTLDSSTSESGFIVHLIEEFLDSPDKNLAAKKTQ